MFLFVSITFDLILGDFFEVLVKSRNPRWQKKDGCHSEMIMQLLRQVTSLLHDLDGKGDIFRCTICPPSLVVIAFIFSELWK